VFDVLDKKPRAPFFLFVAYMDPHDPYYPHPYDGTAYARAAHPNPEPSEAARLSRLYDGEIAFWDQHFGALIADLKKRGLYDQLTIVVTADHGEEFQEHGGFWHGTTLYDEVVRVPLLIKLPGNQRGGSVLTSFVQSIDLMPTLLEFAKLPVPHGVQGHDAFEGNDAVFAEESHEGNVLSSLRLSRTGSTLKLISANPGNPRGLQPLELYHVDRDPHEQVNMAGDELELVNFAHKALDEQATNAALGRASQRKVDVADDTSAAARLRALGYAGGDKPQQ
jgi:arylsulfatase A-like enzyme